jgi:hypothetical protein
MPVKQLLGLEIENTGYAVYQNSFSALNSIAWRGRHWRRTPFGACYAVWSQVGAEPVTQDLNTGWVYNTTGGVAGEVVISLPEGYSTVYFPLIKDMGNFDPRSIFWARWLNRDGTTYDHGLMSLADFDDSNTFSFPNYPGYTQNVHSAMIFPVVCKSSRLRRVRLQVRRNLDGGGVWLGRPIVLPGACSWIVPANHP